MKISIFKFKSIFIFLFIFISILYLYTNQIQPDNEYVGMKSIVYNFRFFTMLIFHFILIIFLIRYKNTLIINFINLYLLFVIIWFLIFFDLVGEVELKHYLLLLTIYLIPIIIFKLLSNSIFNFNKNLNLIIPRVKLPLFVSLEIILTIILIFNILLIGSLLSLNFDYASSYSRRSLGYEMISGFTAYIFSMSLNGIAPYLAFLSIFKKKYIYFFISLLFTIMSFGFIGTKAPIFYTLIFAFLGFIISSRSFNVSYFMLKVIFLVLFVSVVEYLIFNYSLVADIIVRRAFIVVSQNQIYFIDYFFNYFDFYDWIFGKGKDITYIVGDIYHIFPNTNANVNAFLYEIGRNGIFGFIIMNIFLLIFFTILDYIYKKYNKKEILGVGILYVILLFEQSYSTAFVTSGIGLITILTILAINIKEENGK
ncbi:O-antigen polymerase [Aliarcobacter skirrowii]|uniref:O-antigen polymerase n=1 Tax=Aliarcobacter skirrowii TaxID=28200 RepID=UPI0029B4B6C4|nr:O-antigen polymerase [Aliarcobacter skirrowii]MDX4048464.1 O-antigen polymerase [Aliarcobacter skirrowii]